MEPGPAVAGQEVVPVWVGPVFALAAAVTFWLSARSGVPGPSEMAVVFFVVVSLAGALVDARSKLLPDVLTFPFLGAGLGAAA